jgi:hypothetical protein
MLLPESIQFLNNFLLKNIRLFESAPWLLSNFDDDLWSVSFGFSQPIELNWKIYLSDGSGLIDKKNRPLLTVFKHWLIASTSNKDSGGLHTTALKSQYVRFNTTLHIIDLFVMDCGEYNVAKFGLEMLTRNNLKDLLVRISANNEVALSIYQWPVMLRGFCLELLSKCDLKQLHRIVRQSPYLSVITEDQKANDVMGLPLEIVPYVRAALLVEGFYVFNSTKGYHVHSAKVSRIIYSNTIAGIKSQKPIMPMLMFSLSDEIFTREFDGVPIQTSQHSRMSAFNLRFYRIALLDLRQLYPMSLALPQAETLDCVTEVFIEGGDQGRYGTVPANVMRHSVAAAIKYHINHGRALVETYCKLASLCKELSLSIADLTEEQFQSCLHNELKELGVKKLGLACRRPGFAAWTAPVTLSSKEYFAQVRKNVGFLELLAIYYGAAQLVVGLLSARRSKELRDLPENCFDRSRKWLVFLNQKASRSTSVTRQLMARPLDDIAVDMVANIQWLHDELEDLGFVDDTYPLFSAPGLKGAGWLIKPDVFIYYRNMDLFQDYIESPLDAEGRRYYVRQHQLRRFFALLFYTSFKGARLDTLRWYFGHSDFKHIYNYITSVVPGADLRSAKATAIAERLTDHGWPAYKELAQLLKDEFGVENFKLASTARLEMYLDELLKKEAVALEPKFFIGSSGEKMQIMVLVRGGEREYQM